MLIINIKLHQTTVDYVWNIKIILHCEISPLFIDIYVDFDIDDMGAGIGLLFVYKFNGYGIYFTLIIYHIAYKINIDL